MSEAGGDPGAVRAGSAELEQRARVLNEALPYLQRFRGATIVVKYGGAAMVDETLADIWASDVVLLEHVGLRPLVVHGGGPALTKTMERLGLETEFVDGHRRTSAESAEVAEMVLTGRINKEVVSRLVRAGAKAIGLSGTDAGLIRVRPHRPDGADLGFVGAVESVNAAPLELLLGQGYTPVLSSTATDGEGQTWNINADSIAGAIAGALRAQKLVFLSDVPGVLLGGELRSRLTASVARTVLDDREASGGMRPKLEAALTAIAAGVERVHLVDGRVPHALLLEIFTAHGVGTLVEADPKGATS